MINVTKPFLPPQEEYQNYVAGIWKREWLTNNGPLVNELEIKLKDYLKIKNLLFLGNGTIAIQIAIKALGLTGEIITTPFSYVATTSSIVWENCDPVMVDILPTSLTIDPAKIEAAITPRTTGILATHVYGNACEVDEIEKIAAKHNLKVIYDAAHTFGTKYKGKSLFEYGDVSTTSFHATKLFHTIEGGAVFARNDDVLTQMSMMRNFGHVNAIEFGCVGINGKNSEFHAAMGLCNLKYIQDILTKRRELSERYHANLAGAALTFPTITQGCEFNYAYFPVLLQSEEALLHLVQKLNLHNIFPRRYFSPSLSHLPYLEKKFDTPISDDASSRALCLPLYHTLSIEEVDLVCSLVKKFIA